MACKYKINGVWYSEEEVKSIFEQSEKKSKEYYALVDKLESATPEEKQDIEAKIAELDKEFLVESKEELPSTVIPETTENVSTESLEDTNEEQVDFVGKNDSVETIVEGELQIVNEVVEQESITKQSPIIKLPRSERDVVKPSQVLMPWKFKAKMSKYIKNGKLDMSKIDPKILTGFGMRIPNQGPNSQVAFE